MMERDTSHTRRASLGKRTIKDVINRYVDEIIPGLPMQVAPTKTLRAIERAQSIVDEPLARVTSESISAWRDERLGRVSRNIVGLEVDLLTAMLEIARTEWGWLQYNPALSVQRPRPAYSKRIRRVSDIEALAICEALGYEADDMVGTAPKYTALAFLLAIETGLRKYEMQSLLWSNVHLDKGYLSIPSGDEKDDRIVPLTKRAERLFEQLFRFDDDDRCIPLSEYHANQSWARARKLALKRMPSVADLLFNDSRYEAMARMAKRFDLLPLSRIVGQGNLAALVIYYLDLPESEEPMAA